MSILNDRRLYGKEDAFIKLYPWLGQGSKGLYWYSTVGSTMDTAFKLPDRAIRNRTLVVADDQTQGRGRYDRKWVSTAADLTFSVILTEYDFRVPYSMIAALSVYRTLKTHGGRVCLKWINDVLWENSKKISGALTEEKMNRTVIGIGLNLNSDKMPQDLDKTATSYYIETGKGLVKEEILSLLIKELFGMLDRVDNGEVCNILSEWESDAGLKGKRITVVNDNGRIQGTVSGINKNSGALILKTEKGFTEVYEGNVVQNPSS
jgi:BirA family biotin operon repressor/biotin-[acetyl-CoA-carboxylase] ligase